MRAVQAGQQFGQNLVGAAANLVREAPKRTGEIIDRLRKRSDSKNLGSIASQSAQHGGMPLDQQQLFRLWSLKNPGKTGVTVGELEEFGKQVYAPEEGDVEEFGKGMEVNPTDFNLGAPSEVTQQGIRQSANISAPAAVSAAISKQEGPKFNLPSPITQQAAARMLQVQTPGQSPIRTPIDGAPLSVTPETTAQYIRSSARGVRPIEGNISTRPLTTQGPSEIKRPEMSFTKGMSDAEVSAEFEKIFGKEDKNLPIGVKKDMIERFRLGEMAETGAIFGGDPMYEMEIDPNTGELKLNPKKKR